MDNVARRELWQAGLDYGHGTGHGVGAFLNVHEYPPLITSRPSASSPGIMENMFTSDGKFFLKTKPTSNTQYYHVPNYAQWVVYSLPYFHLSTFYFTLACLRFSS